MQVIITIARGRRGGLREAIYGSYVHNGHPDYNLPFELELEGFEQQRSCRRRRGYNGHDVFEIQPEHLENNTIVADSHEGAGDTGEEVVDTLS